MECRQRASASAAALQAVFPRRRQQCVQALRTGLLIKRPSHFAQPCLRRQTWRRWAWARRRAARGWATRPRQASRCAPGRRQPATWAQRWPSSCAFTTSGTRSRDNTRVRVPWGLRDRRGGGGAEQAVARRRTARQSTRGCQSEGPPRAQRVFSSALVAHKGPRAPDHVACGAIARAGGAAATGRLHPWRSLFKWRWCAAAVNGTTRAPRATVDGAASEAPDMEALIRPTEGARCRNRCPQRQVHARARDHEADVRCTAPLVAPTRSSLA